MANTSARSLQLLSLLQRRRFWSGADLAERLNVSERTLRRDIDRLRDLGYAIAATPGVEGGYRFEAGAALPPLQFDTDEAVALTVALHTAAGATFGPASSSGLAEASAGALAKIIPVLPPDLRARSEALRSFTEAGTRSGAGDRRGVELAPVLAVIGDAAQACRDQLRLNFGYDAGSGANSERYVEPYRLVTLGNRWYLVAFDIDRDDWRTFRLDRMSRLRATRTSFDPRPLPADDLVDYVRSRIRALSFGYRIEVDIALPAEAVVEALGAWVTAVPKGDRTLLSFDADRLDWPLMMVSGLDAPFTIVGPPRLIELAGTLAQRFAAAIPSGVTAQP
jgi:predicted DNA-binding transcriptional regulator YafY